MAGWKRFGNEPNETDKFFFNLGLRGNAVIQEIAFRMIDEADTLEETFNEYRMGRPKTDKNQNATFYQLRKDMRDLISLTEAHLQRNKLIDADKQTIEACHTVMHKPYGQYDLREITKLAHDFYNILIRKGIIAVVAGWEETTPESRFNKF